MNWILVPVCNGLHLTQTAVKLFLKQEGGITRVMLIDNATTDGTAEWARSKWPSVVTLHKNPPLSVAASWNKGLTLLFSDPSVKHVLVVNNDTELRPDTYRRLLEDGGDFVTAVSVGDRAQMVDIDPRGKRPHPDFSCYLIRRKAWETVGLFDENFKGAFFEDNDYHLRLHKAGIDAHCIDVPFYHVGSASIAQMGEVDRLKLQALAVLNSKYFESKWGFKAASKEYYAAFNDAVQSPAGVDPPLTQ